ncbi:ATP-binding cassette domain-containing protein [Arthrobacter sp. TES]|nr:ATP-binding cassette domain-containing protein [Paenarthrobacter ureafaciens]QOI64791.1 ATP-binding cassette domain-containing protein [Arthrobacter sp. TES]
MRTHPSSVIQISRLVKNFGSTVALSGLELSVRAGEVHGFLGPNGAGKSTTLRILLGLIRSDAWCGGRPWHPGSVHVARCPRVALAVLTHRLGPTYPSLYG